MNIYKNILEEKERLKLLKFCKTEVKDLGDRFPGLQSPPNLHKKKELKIFLDSIKLITNGYKITSCWVNKVTGEDLCWHQHPDVDLSIVYYLERTSKKLNSINFIFESFAPAWPTVTVPAMLTVCAKPAE